MVLAVPFFTGSPLEGFAVPPPAETISPVLPDGTPQQRMAVLYRALARRVADVTATGELPVVYAGDCLAVIGVVAGLQQRGISPTVVWFDAHGDFHTWETTRSDFLGGMPLAMIVGRGEQTVVTGAGMTPLPETQIVLVDARDLDPGEDETVAASGIEVLTVADTTSWDPGDRALVVHVDVDVVDPKNMPAVNYPAPGGPSLEEVATALVHLAGSKIAAFSISAWNPDLPGAERAAAATMALAEPFLGRSS